MDEARNMRKHVEYAAAKTEKIISALSKLIPVVKGPKASKRKILCRVGHSILIYGAPLLSKALKSKRHLNLFQKCQRKMALRICSAYRTVSTEAALVIAGVTPIRIMVKERAYLYKVRNLLEKKEAKQRASENSMSRWQREWERSSKGSWTRKLIPIIKTWTERMHGKCSYFLSQVLTGHGTVGRTLWYV